MKLLGDEYNLKILSATSVKPKSISRLASELDIPEVSCYRKVKELHDNHLLDYVCNVPSKRGRDKRMFKTNLISFQIKFMCGKFDAQIYFDNNRNPLNIESSKLDFLTDDFSFGFGE